MENQYIRLVKVLRYTVLICTIMLLVCAGAIVVMSSEKQNLTDSGSLQNNIQHLLQAMKPGDKLPDSFWDMPMELDDFKGKKSKFKFGDMKGRIIIFDFWSTTCKSCIENIPHMEQIQGKYPDDLAIILVNSKRNKDTPGRINATMKRYKEQYKYDIGLFTILDDTLLTTLFPHNAIPSTAWINREGIYMGNTMSNEVNERNIESVLKTGKSDMAVTQVYRNYENHNDVPPLRDTVGESFISEFTKFTPYYLPNYPNIVHKNGNSLFQIVNSTFAHFLYHTYQKEVADLFWTDYVFDPDMQDVKYKLLNSLDNNNIFNYELYVQDSLSQTQAYQYLRDAFSKFFKLNVERRKGNISVYQVSYNRNFDQIKTKGEMPIVQPYPGLDPEYYRNMPVSSLLNNLFFYIDKPIVFDFNDNPSIDIMLPIDFAKRSIPERLSFLEEHGIQLTPVYMDREYVLISRLK
ncbi:TlpA disulfide reductase family protein [Sphingobacterium faecium]|uniref:TlpA family protein disulfide reductase n=1 Tax=Sphingobacterium faecium TaxID=34087 RepID=UPI003209DF7D